MTKLPLSLEVFKDQIPENEEMHLFLKGDVNELKLIITALEGHYKYTHKQYTAAIIPFQNLQLLNDFDQVEAIHFELGQGQVLLNESRIHSRIKAVHDGTANLPAAYKGNGVIMGVIDAGIDLQHPDFQFENGSTRILELWDQTMGYNALRTPSYGYGQVFDSTDINANNCPHEDQTNYYGHGTNTSGIAAGNGLSNAQFTGCAPQADLIIVSSKFTSFSWTSTVADAVDYIFERAEFYGKPCVINASIGSYLGSHDGRDIPTQLINDKLDESSGRIMVCAAGNSGEAHPYHLGYEATNDTSFTWFKTASSASAGNGVVFFEGFGNVGEMESLQFSIGADKVNPSYEFRGSTPFDSIENRLFINVTDTLWSINGTYLGVVETWADSINGTYRLQIYAHHIDSVQYNFRLSTTGQGRIDVWSTSDDIINLYDMVYQNLPSTLDFPAISNYKLPDYKQQIVSNWACSDHVITVGNFTNRKNYIDVDGATVTFASLTAGAIASTSSSGPNRLGDLKPEVVAPGDITLTAGASFQIEAQLVNLSQRNRVAIGGLHNKAGGTSSASPVIAGLAALFLEKCPNGNWLDFKTALAQGSVSDAFTGTVPNDKWGNGKVDAVKTLRFHAPHPSLSVETEAFCAGDSVSIAVNGNYNAYEWISGQTNPGIFATQSGQYFAQVTNEMGCLGNSDSVDVFRRPLPLKPILLVSGSNPSCPNETLALSVANNYGSYLWSNGRTTNSIEALQNGLYYCAVKNSYGCINYSDSIDLQFFPEMARPNLWHKFDDVLVIETDSGTNSMYAWYWNNEIIDGETDSSYQATEIGTYIASLIDKNGCEWLSNPVEIGILNTDDLTRMDWQISPNPFKDAIIITAPIQAVNSSWKLFSLSGALVKTGELVSDSQIFDLSYLNAGVYILNLYTETTSVHIQLVKL